MIRPESWILSCLVNCLWQAPLLFLAGSLAARLVRSIGPRAEHRVWVAVLLAQSVLPALSLVPFIAFWSWLAALLARLTGAAAPSHGHVSVFVGPGVVLGGPALSGSLLAAVAAAYTALCAWLVARFVWRCIRLRRLRSTARDLSPATDLARLCGLRAPGNIRIAASARIFAPLTMGVGRPLILLPERILAAGDPADLRAAVAHEYAHIRRGDFLKNLFYEFLALPVSLHPCVRLARERLMETREMVCDSMAAEPGARNDYARALLRLASLLVDGMPSATPHAIGIFDANTLERRIMQLTEKQNEIRGLRRAALVSACALFGLVTCASALALRMNVSAAAAGSSSETAKAPRAVYVASGVMAANKIWGPAPEYPDVARKAKIEGAVVLATTIDKEGEVSALHVVSGPPVLQQSAMDAVRQWKYRPYLLNGEPVEVRTQVNVVYSLTR